MLPTTTDIWADHLAREARGLNFADHEDRVTYRLRIMDMCSMTRVHLVREIAKHFGAVNVPMTGKGAARALANTWIDRR
jgi:hypothetical protein